MRRCEGGVHAVDCDNVATWLICCPNDACLSEMLACDPHEMQARLTVATWLDEGGHCTACGFQFTNAEHTTRRWYRLPEPASSSL